MTGRLSLHKGCCKCNLVLLLLTFALLTKTPRGAAEGYPKDYNNNYNTLLLKSVFMTSNLMHREFLYNETQIEARGVQEKDVASS